MAKPRVFISSTYYDLKHIRSSIDNFIYQLGYESVLSEKGNIPYTPDKPLDQSCYREVKNTDIFVLIIGGRYGSEKSGDQSTGLKTFYDNYDSITKQEYQSARENNIPIYILIEKSAYSDFETFTQNKSNKDIKYPHVDSVNIFYLIEHILAQPRNNPIYQFDRFNEIEGWLKEQWAGHFKVLLNSSANQQQISSLSAQVTELSEINKTLKIYLEKVVTHVLPRQESTNIINDETERLKEIEKTKLLTNNELFIFLRDNINLTVDIFKNIIETTTSYNDFIEQINKKSNTLATCDICSDLKQNKDQEIIVEKINEARRIIGIPPIKFL